MQIIDLRLTILAVLPRFLFGELERRIDQQLQEIDFEPANNRLNSVTNSVIVFAKQIRQAE